MIYLSTCEPACLSTYLRFSPSFCLLVYLSKSMTVYLSTCLVYMSISSLVHWSAYLPIYLSVCSHIYLFTARLFTNLLVTIWVNVFQTNYLLFKQSVSIFVYFSIFLPGYCLPDYLHNSQYALTTFLNFNFSICLLVNPSTCQTVYL